MKTDASSRLFNALYLGHYNFVLRCVRRFGVSEADVEDAAQDVFVVVFRRLDTFRPGSSERAWLSVIASHVASDHRRRARRKPSEPIDQRRLPSRDRGPFSLVARAEAALHLETILCSMDAGRREVFLLAECRQLSAPEISEALGVNVNTVYTRLRAGRRHFMTAVGRSNSEREPERTTVARG